MLERQVFFIISGTHIKKRKRTAHGGCGIEIYRDGAKLQRLRTDPRWESEMVSHWRIWSVEPRKKEGASYRTGLMRPNEL